MAVRKPSMQMIADRLGVSKVSVSKVLNNQDGISAELRRQVLQVANELGYISSRQAAAETYRLAFLVPKHYFLLENERFYTTIYYYFNRECISRQFPLSLFVISKNEEENLILQPSLTKDNFDGLILAGEMNGAYLKALMDLRIPAVTVDFYKQHLVTDCILTDNFYISYSATNYLIDMGHKDIGFVGDPKETSSVTDRFFGYRKALLTADLPYRSEWNILNNDPVGGYTSDIILPEVLPTAFMCHCDMSAYYLIKTLKKSGLRIPEDISVISFDNTELSQNSEPALTTVDIDKREFARKALEKIILRAQDPLKPAERIFVSSQLVHRDSVRSL